MAADKGAKKKKGAKGEIWELIGMDEDGEIEISMLACGEDLRDLQDEEIVMKGLDGSKMPFRAKLMTTPDVHGRQSVHEVIVTCKKFCN